MTTPLGTTKVADYFQRKINSGVDEDTDECRDKIPLSLLPIEELKAVISRIQKTYNDYGMSITTSVLQHPVLQSELESESNGPTALKHLKQIASILGHMKKANLLQPQTNYVEFGAGKGLLSHWVQRSLSGSPNSTFLLVDRGANRYKFDNLHKGPSDGPKFERLRMDIEHLCLSKVASIADSHQAIVAISKHLCGAATDLALRCLTQTLKGSEEQLLHTEACKRMKIDTSSRLKAIIIALCCHHQCSWTSYVGKNFLKTQGFSQKDFNTVSRLTSWATCGSRQMDSTSTENDDDMVPDSKTTLGRVLDSKTTPGIIHESSVPQLETVCHDTVVSESKTASNIINKSSIDESNTTLTISQNATEYTKFLDSMSINEREDIGRMCKKVIDIGRKIYLENHNMKVDFTYYVDNDISLENVLLIATQT
ncbi:tRNA:m(4)X modification enzyme TRM13 homolog [Glandiceps talaboti]